MAIGRQSAFVVFVVPAEREAREPGPISPHGRCDRWVPALASLGRDDGGDISQTTPASTLCVNKNGK
jgi:hypothetical protein